MQQILFLRFPNPASATGPVSVVTCWRSVPCECCPVQRSGLCQHGPFLGHRRGRYDSDVCMLIEIRCVMRVQRIREPQGPVVHCMHLQPQKFLTVTALYGTAAWVATFHVYERYVQVGRSDRCRPHTCSVCLELRTAQLQGLREVAPYQRAATQRQVRRFALIPDVTSSTRQHRDENRKVLAHMCWQCMAVTRKYSCCCRCRPGVTSSPQAP